MVSNVVDFYRKSKGAANDKAAQCLDCQVRNVYRFDWGNVCCRVRFLLGQPNRDARIQWIDRWRKKGEGEIASKVVSELKRIANDR